MRILHLPPVLAVRRSFRSKLLLSLLGSVALLVLIPLLVVRRETARGIELATARAEQRSREAFSRLEDQNHQQLSQLVAVFTESVQAPAALEAALEGGDTETLARDVEYEFTARRIPQQLVAFTDAYGEPVLAMMEQTMLDGDDPVGIAQPALRILEEGAEEVRAYRAVNGRLFSIQTMLLELGRPIGTVTVGVPITEEHATFLSSIIDAEVCFVVGGECVVGTARARTELHAAITAAAAVGGSFVEEDAAGDPWRIIAAGITADDTVVSRVIAVPLAEVIGPFRRVQRALVLGGLGALLLAVVLSTFLSRSLTRPVRALVGATTRIGAGDYTAAVDVHSVDEMGTLSRAFNDMASGLALKERYRGLLDKVVSPEIADELLKGDVVLGGETREVTVVFADIVGFTRITDGMPPARVIAMLNECMERLTAVVEQSGGVVDKYVGDEIMALFGAPIARGDDVLRAVHAAVGMQQAMRELNAARAQRGEPPLEVSIGMNTGDVMAGNMGSISRLNYTVIGDSVNLAARVESAADGGQVLMSEHTFERVREHVEVRDTGLHEMRGFAQPVRLYELVSLRTIPVLKRAHAGALAGAVLALCAVAPAAHAQVIPELPTLENVRIESAGGWFQLGLSGRLDLEGYFPGDDPAWIIPSTAPFVAPRLRLFGDAFFGDRFVASAELRIDRGEEPAAEDMEVRLDQLFARFTAAPVFALQLGKFVSPFAGYGQRHHTAADPLIRPPLPYDYRTILDPRTPPASGEGLLSRKDMPDQHRPWGAPVIWGAPYQWGAMMLGSLGPVQYRAAVMNSAPSSEPEQWGLDRGFDAPSWVMNAGVQALPSLRLELSYNQGPWMNYYDAYDQRIWGAEAVFVTGGTKLRGEVFHDSWGVPDVGYDVVDVSWYVEAERDVVAGLTLAGRYGAIHFGEVHAAAWDYDTQRLQLGAGYRLARNVGVRVEGMVNRTQSPQDPDDDLFSVQLWWAF